MGCAILLTMYGEDRELLAKTLALAEENNKMLHQMRRGARWHNLFSVLRWIVIIIIAAGSYYYLQPYLDSARRIYSAIAPVASSTASSLQLFLPDLSHLWPR